MENASRALIIAGGILLTMLIVSLLLFGYKSISNFYNAQDELQEIQDVAKFNAQFTGYDRDNVRGYELISLANKIADYNERYSIAEGAQNDKNFAPITLVIDFDGETNRKSLLYNSSDSNRLFIEDKIEQNKTNNEIVEIIKKIGGIVNIYGGTEKANILARNIDSLIFDRAKSNYDQTKFSADQIKDFLRIKYNELTSENLDTYDKVEEKLIGTGAEMKIFQYYEFNQFKKAKFECTNIEYDDNVSGRVSKLEFKFKNL